MPLETGTYIPDLVNSNPAHGDGVNQGDGHLRLIKSVILNTLPNWTRVALASTQAQIDQAVNAVVNGVTQLIAQAGTVAAPGIAFLGSLSTGIYSPGANQLAVTTNGVQSMSVSAMQVTNFPTPVQTFGTQGQVVPIGMPMPWLASTVPNSNWIFLSGQAISRTGFPILFALWGTYYGAGDGSSTFNVPNLAEVVLVGAKGMNGAANRSLTSQLANSGVLGAVIGEGSHTLSLGEAPTGQFTFNAATHSHGYNIASSGSVGGGGVGNLQTVEVSTTGASTSSVGTGDSITDHAGGGAHNNVQGSYVVNYITPAG